MASTFIYAINRLRVNGEYTNRVTVSKAADAQAGRTLGIEIENRGGGDARWVFCCIIEDSNKYLDCHDAKDADLLALGIDLRRFRPFR
jgi:hypothetical protein